MTQLSVVIPVYNEAATIGTILREVANALPEVSKQIIIVDDCSRDGTAQWLRRNLGAAQGVWRGIAVNDDGEIELRRQQASNIAGLECRPGIRPQRLVTDAAADSRSEDRRCRLRLAL